MGLEDTNNLRDWDKRLGEQYRRGWDNYIRRRIYLDVARELECWGICGEFFYVEEVSSALAIGSIRLNRNTNDPIDLVLGTVVKTIFCNIFITHAALQGEWIDVIYGINFEYYKEHAIDVNNITNIDNITNIQTLDTINNVVHIDDNSSTITIDIAAGQKISEVTTVASITNVVHVDDNGGTVTVDGAVTIQEPLSVDDNGGSLTVDGSVTAVDNGIAQPCIIITNVAADANTVGANHACKRVLIRAHTINTGLVWVDFNNAAVALACYPLAAGDSVGVPLTNTNLVNCLFKVANEKVTVVYTN